LLETMILWVKHMQENGIKMQESIEKEIKDELKSVLPEIFQSGIQEVDEKFQPQKEFFEKNMNLNLNLNLNILNLANVGIGKPKFKNKNEFPNLNELYKKKQQSVLPSLFNMFLTANDPLVETKSIKLITKLFSQYEDLSKQIRSLEIIFDKEESSVYIFLTDLINAAKYLIEKCEVFNKL